MKKGGKGRVVSSEKDPTDAHHPAPADSGLLQAEMECEYTQDSVVDDSGFLPSTPPAKKVSGVQMVFL